MESGGRGGLARRSRLDKEVIVFSKNTGRLMKVAARNEHLIQRKGNALCADSAWDSPGMKRPNSVPEAGSQGLV